MGDCLWIGVGICSCTREMNMSNCTKYLSMNSKKGEELEDKYRKDIDAAIEPVRQKYKEEYFDGKTE